MKIFDVIGFVLLLVCVIGLVVTLSAAIEKQNQQQPHNMPSQDEVRQIMLDCEQYSPGKRCVFVAMTVPDFSESVGRE